MGESLSGSSVFPEVFPPRAKDATSQGDNGIGTLDRPMHAGLFESLPDDRAAPCFDHP